MAVRKSATVNLGRKIIYKERKMKNLEIIKKFCKERGTRNGNWEDAIKYGYLTKEDAKRIADHITNGHQDIYAMHEIRKIIPKFGLRLGCEDTKNKK